MSLLAEEERDDLPLVNLLRARDKLMSQLRHLPRRGARNARVAETWPFLALSAPLRGNSTIGALARHPAT